MVIKKASNSLFFLVVGLIVLFSSCRSSHQVLYDPQEVAYLSKLLNIPIRNNDKDMRLLAESSLWLGTPYRYGGSTRKGIDCSGFVNQIFKKIYGKELQRSTALVYKKNVKKVRKGRLRTGDLVFFKISKQSKDVDHMGIFLRDGYFIHASTTKGVIVSNLNEKYYKKYWKKGGRVK